MKGGNVAAFFVRNKPREARPTARSSIAQQHRAAGQPQRGGRGRGAEDARRAGEPAARDGGEGAGRRTAPNRRRAGAREAEGRSGARGPNVAERGRGPRDHAGNAGGETASGRRAVGCPCGAPTFSLRRPYLGTPPTARHVPCKPSIYRGWTRVG